MTTPGKWWPSTTRSSVHGYGSQNSDWAFVGLSSLRAVLNAWMSTIILAHPAEKCGFGYGAMGGDSLIEYHSRPTLGSVARASGLRGPTLATSGLIKNVLLRCSWWQMRGTAEVWTAVDVAFALRAQVRPLNTRSLMSALISGALLPVGCVRVDLMAKGRNDAGGGGFCST